jgi:tRNA A37 threonylcarbamoyladenosine modification protein TsaB
MTLIIDTSDSKHLKVEIEGLSFIKIPALFKQSEKLLPTIEKALQREKIKFKDIKKIKVADSGDSFTALRIGLLTANALAFALKIPIESLNDQNNKKIQIRGVELIKPQYQSEPIIGKKKNN